MAAKLGKKLDEVLERLTKLDIIENRPNNLYTTMANIDGVISNEGLCMLWKRLCYPCRYSDMVHLFTKPVPVLCRITNEVLDYIYQVHSHCILQWNRQLLSQANLERFAEVVHQKGSPLDNCCGFVDGTVRPICRPSTVNQRLLYNGRKRVHGIKLQSVVTLDGMINAWPCL